jgi:hypothetical protein
MHLPSGELFGAWLPLANMVLPEIELLRLLIRSGRGRGERESGRSREGSLTCNKEVDDERMAEVALRRERNMQPDDRHRGQKGRERAHQGRDRDGKVNRRGGHVEPDLAAERGMSLL